VNRLPIAFLTAILAVVFTVGPSHADLTGGVEFSRDSDDADKVGYYTGYDYTFERGSRAGFRIGFQELSDTVGTERFNVLELTQLFNPAGTTSMSLELKMLNGDDWSPLLGSGNVTFKPGQMWDLEIFGEREIVDTVSAVRLQYLLDSYGFSADCTVSEEITLVGALFNQAVSDGNKRVGSIGRIVYTPQRLDWMNFQVKARVLESDFDGIGYFSPETLTELFFLFGAARTFAGDNWVVRGLTGPGVQWIDEHGGEREKKPAFLLEVKLKGWFTQEFGLDGKIGYTTARAGSGSDRYLYGHINLRHTWW
jgi:hypothetical protein